MRHKIGLILAIVIISMLVFFAVKQLTTPTVLSKNDITAQIEKSFQADILSIIEQPAHYIASFIKDESVYEVTIERENGQLSHLTLVQKNSETQPTKPPTESKPPAKPSVLTEQQAIDLALKEVPGELDSVEFESTVDGGNYFIEIEQDDNEITVQVHAITGKILSIQYED